MRIYYKFRNNNSVLEENRIYDPTAPLTAAISNSQTEEAVSIIQNQRNYKVINERTKFGNNPLTLSVAKGWDHLDYSAEEYKRHRFFRLDGPPTF